MTVQVPARGGARNGMAPARVRISGPGRGAGPRRTDGAWPWVFIAPFGGPVVPEV